MSKHEKGNTEQHQDFKFAEDSAGAEQGEAYKELLEANREEHEKWQKNLKEVVNAFRKKGDAMKLVVKAMKQKTRGASDIRLLVMAMGGGVQGSYGAGQMCALQQMGYTSSNINEEDVFLGMSAGSAICAFGMAGKKQALLGTSYFYNICCTKAFVDYLRINKMVDISVIEKALRNPPTMLDTNAVLKSPAQFYIQAFNESKQEPEFINAKDPKLDMVAIMHSSMAIPFFYDKAISIKGSKYTDGAFDDPLPIVRAIKQFSPTHVFILPNMPFNRAPLEEQSLISKALVPILPLGGSLGMIRKVLKSRQSLRESLERIAESHQVKIGVAWPPEMGLQTLSQDVAQVKAAIKASALSIFKLFGEPERSLKLYEEEYV